MRIYILYTPFPGNNALHMWEYRVACLTNDQFDYVVSTGGYDERKINVNPIATFKYFKDSPVYSSLTLGKEAKNEAFNYSYKLEKKEKTGRDTSVIQTNRSWGFIEKYSEQLRGLI